MKKLIMLLVLCLVGCAGIKINTNPNPSKAYLQVYQSFEAYWQVEKGALTTNLVMQLGKSAQIVDKEIVLMKDYQVGLVTSDVFIITDDNKKELFGTICFISMYTAFKWQLVQVLQL